MALAQPRVTDGWDSLTWGAGPGLHVESAGHMLELVDTLDHPRSDL